MSNLHAVCSPYHSTLYDFFLMGGFREQEAMHVVWNNVRFNANIIEMRWKPQFNWTPKAYKEREVPVPDELLEILEAHRRSLPAHEHLLRRWSSARSAVNAIRTCSEHSNEMRGRQG